MKLHDSVVVFAVLGKFARTHFDIPLSPDTFSDGMGAGIATPQKPSPTLQKLRRTQRRRAWLVLYESKYCACKDRWKDFHNVYTNYEHKVE